MSKYKKIPIPDDLRQAVFKRDNYTCRYCGTRQGPLHCDHVYPERHGGKAVMGNMVTACKKCNVGKKDKVGIWPLRDAELKQISIAKATISRKNAVIGRSRRVISEKDRKLGELVKSQEKDIATREHVNLGIQVYLLAISAVSFPGILYGIEHNLVMWFAFIPALWIPLICIIFLKIYVRIVRRALSKRK